MCPFYSRTFLKTLCSLKGGMKTIDDLVALIKKKNDSKSEEDPQNIAQSYSRSEMEHIGVLLDELKSGFTQSVQHFVSISVRAYVGTVLTCVCACRCITSSRYKEASDKNEHEIMNAVAGVATSMKEWKEAAQVVGHSSEMGSMHSEESMQHHANVAGNCFLCVACLLSSSIANPHGICARCCISYPARSPHGTSYGALTHRDSVRSEEHRPSQRSAANMGERIQKIPRLVTAVEVKCTTFALHMAGPTESYDVTRRLFHFCMPLLCLRSYSMWFLVSAPKDDEEAKQIREESEEYGDIMLMSYLTEDYHLIGAKVVEFFHAASLFPQLQFVMKGDDDTFVRIDRLLAQLDEHRDGNLFLGCSMGE